MVSDLLGGSGGPKIESRVFPNTMIDMRARSIVMDH